ncbi:MAG: radical SAM protein, partial [Planctomycetota bacterium]
MDPNPQKQTVPLGLYCHVPFCPAPCDFCAFYRMRPSRADIVEYLAGIDLEVSSLELDRPVNTLYFGGGTPGMLSTRDLERLCDATHTLIKAPPLEWSVEMAPSTIHRTKMQMLKERGVTRVSMGVQSFDDPLLKKMGRPHVQRHVIDAYQAIRDAGFTNVNLDMIIGVPGQTEEMLLSDLGSAVALAPEHLSLYCLTCEQDT